jgi:putative ABC transport system permease protein
LSGSRWMRTLRLGLSSLLLHKLRSFLTTLGVLFGVSSVIAMLAVGEGASVEAQDQIRQLGSQNVILRSVKPPDDKVSNQQSRVLRYGLTHMDRERVSESFPGVRRVVPLLEVQGEVRNGARVALPRILATPASYLDVTGRVVHEGRFVTPEDERDANAVCVLGSEVARVLFPFESSIEKTVRIGPDYFQVVGTLLPRVPLGDDPARAGVPVASEVFIPFANGIKWYGGRQVKIRSGSMEMEEVDLHELIVEVKRAEDVPFVAAACRSMLERNHDRMDYEVIVPLELLMRAKETQRIFNIVLGSIAGISLLVGGIGIMNVMLATVTERTREIGVRRALGAKRAHIISQFLTETIVLSAGGGLLGVALGMAIPMAVEHFADMRTIVTLQAPILAFSISVATGIIFGLYPAWRAAAMDPVEALRHE